MTAPTRISADYARIDNRRSARDLVLHWGAIVAAVAFAHTLAHPLAYLLAALAIAGLQNGLTSLAHEAWHGKAFESRTVNQGVGAWLYAYPIGLPYYHDQVRHLSHHRLVGRDSDPDWPNYEGPDYASPRAVLRFLAGKLLGLHLVTTFVYLVVRGRPRILVEVDDPDLPPSRVETARIVCVQLVLLGAFSVFGHWWEYFVLWIAPIATLTSFFISARALIEHAHPDPEIEPEARLYDFDTNALGRFFLSPYHFNLHALHHAYPTVPHYRLRQLKATLADGDELGYPGRQAPGYVRCLWRQIQALRTKDARAQAPA